MERDIPYRRVSSTPCHPCFLAFLSFLTDCLSVRFFGLFGTLEDRGCGLFLIVHTAIFLYSPQPFFVPRIPVQLPERRFKACLEAKRAAMERFERCCVAKQKQRREFSEILRRSPSTRFKACLEARGGATERSERWRFFEKETSSRTERSPRRRLERVMGIEPT
jgi:hypothetical protein